MSRDPVRVRRPLLALLALALLLALLPTLDQTATALRGRAEGWWAYTFVYAWLALAGACALLLLRPGRGARTVVAAGTLGLTVFGVDLVSRLLGRQGSGVLLFAGAPAVALAGVVVGGVAAALQAGAKGSAEAVTRRVWRVLLVTTGAVVLTVVLAVAPVFEVGAWMQGPIGGGPGPAYWRRGCLGLRYTETDVDAEWTRCLGVPYGERRCYGYPFPPPGVVDWSPPEGPPGRIACDARQPAAE